MKKYIVTLEPEEREVLQQLIRKGKAAARKLTHARILLKADSSAGQTGWTDEQIGEALDVHPSTVANVPRRFVEEGLDAALNPRPGGHRQPKLDGDAEAHLIALVCSQPPEGHQRWTLRLLASRIVELQYLDSVSHETVRQTLKKNELKPCLKEQWCIPPQGNAAFVCQMEDVLEVYKHPYDPAYPQVCMDEVSKQLVSLSATTMSIGVRECVICSSSLNPCGAGGI